MSMVAKGGRYANGSAIGYTSRVSRDVIETTTYGFGGDGSWSIRGNTVTLTEDKARGSPDVGQFRLEQESDDGHKWKERLCVLNKVGDICYRREPRADDADSAAAPKTRAGEAGPPSPQPRAWFRGCPRPSAPEKANRWSPPNPPT